LSEGFLEDVGRIQPPVGLQQFFKAHLPFQTQILASREQGIMIWPLV
jgi:hypothetical protein